MNTNPNSEIDKIVRVNRLIRPLYPIGVKKILYPKLESSGPIELDVSRLKVWYSESQKTKPTPGYVICDDIESSGLFERCLSLRDLEEIKKNGAEFFHRNFTHHYKVFGWKSQVRMVMDTTNLLDHIFPNRCVPVLQEGTKGMEIKWVDFYKVSVFNEPTFLYG